MKLWILLFGMLGFASQGLATTLIEGEEAMNLYLDYYGEPQEIGLDQLEVLPDGLHEKVDQRLQKLKPLGGYVCSRRVKHFQNQVMNFNGQPASVSCVTLQAKYKRYRRNESACSARGFTYYCEVSAVEE